MNSNNSNATAPSCAYCDGKTVMFRGSGTSTQFRICPRYGEPGHLSEEEIRDAVAQARSAIRPSGRFG